MKTREQQYIIWSPPTLRTTGIQNARQMHFQKYPTNQPIIAATVKSGHLMGGGTFWTVEPARHRRICCQQRRSTGFSYTVLKQFSTGPRYGNSQRSSITHSLTESGYTSHLRVLLLNYYPHFLDQK